MEVSQVMLGWNSYREALPGTILCLLHALPHFILTATCNMEVRLVALCHTEETSWSVVGKIPVFSKLWFHTVELHIFLKERGP